MKGLTLQGSHLNNLVTSVAKGTLNLTTGQIYHGKVLEITGDKLLLQVGSSKLEAENQAGLQKGDLVMLMVKEASSSKVVLQRLAPAGEEPFLGNQGKEVGLGNKLASFLKTILSTTDNQGAGSLQEPALPKSGQNENPAQLIFPLIINSGDQPLEGELRLWRQDRETSEMAGDDGIWRAVLKFNSQALGFLEADINMKGEKIQVWFRTGQEETRILVNENITYLGQALEKSGFQAKIGCRSLERPKDGNFPSGQGHLDLQA